MEDDNYKTELWNMAMAYHKRIDDILTWCVISYRKDNIKEWRKAIICLSKEIYPKMNEEEMEEDKQLREKMDKEVLKPKTSKKISILPLEHYEKFLRYLLDKKDMLTPRGDDPTKSYRFG